ncbi:MAG: EAL domain-containing protein [Devosia nanyangense]|uniref:EAL domain-containing protein n=1 Tax=Devosia nanyangense TaxID=1228055 RepID=A0A933L767_9HYPH|nr:EAL domain-containing protein [Devosia nanyangense]
MLLPFGKPSVARTVGVLVVAFGVLVGGTWLIAKATSDYLLAQSATITARNWAQYMVASVADLEHIASGELPSAASTVFLEGARKAGQLFRYEIFNREGFSQLIADQEQIAPVDISEFSADAAAAIKSGRPVLQTVAGSPGFPSYFARAYVPVIVEGRPIAIVAAYVDQTDQRDSFYGTFLVGAVALCLLTGVSFGAPAFAWYSRTREKQQADRRIRFLAHHDALTGLSNRAQLIDEMNTAFAVSVAGGDELAVHFIDIDHFKEVNDTLGHDGGDFLLKTVAERLRAVTRLGDTVARLGGDEFVVLETGVVSRNQVEEFAHRLTAAIAEPIRFKEQEIITTVSVGVALAPADGATPERLLKSADLALYKSKFDGRNCVRFFVPEMDADLVNRIALERVIRDAVAHGGFELHFQPLFEVSDRTLLGFEALLRLRGADGEFIPPMTLIPIAEEIRVIDKIGAWVLKEACRTAATWPSHLTVAVNLSPSQFAAGSVSDMVAATLAETGFEAHRLELEITETLLLGNSEAIMAELDKLKAMGVVIVMDDFGTGYSSLSYLWRFPFDKIKIDRSFMQGLGNSGHNAETVIKTIIALGRELDMNVTVEGVETAKQAAFLDAANGDQVQGFFFGRPMPASDVAAEILANRPRPDEPEIPAQARAR